jgi:hypothetical protein
VSAEHEDINAEPGEDDRDAPEAVDESAIAELPQRPDPRLRPPDPAGTRPEWNPDDLLPKNVPVQAAGRLWSSPGESDADDTRRDAASAEVADAVASATDGGTGGTEAAPRYSRYSGRFQFILGALIAVGAAAVVLLVAVLAGGKDDNSLALRAGPSWSSWHPTGTADGPTEIADHVGHEYKLPNGKQLVAVTGGPLVIAGLPITVAIRQTAAQGGDIKLYDGSGVLFRLCGLGPKCAISEGKASTQRHLLLRREALELALYSFRYLGVSEAVVFLPPRKGQSPTQAVFFQRGDKDLATAVARPLDATLVQQTPSISGVTRSPDANLVNTITTTKLFKFSFTQANQDARAFLVLDPLE